MISIVICSKSSDISNELKKNIKETIGINYELIIIDNSKNKYSIFEAYNKGISIAKGDILCFVHEDVLFKSNNWGKIIEGHLRGKYMGIVGIAGSNIITRIPAPWGAYKQKNVNIYQREGTEIIKIYEPKNNTQNKRESILLDGVFLCWQKKNNFMFDESLAGFHGYDYDISLLSYTLGYKNYVIYDISLLHFSPGYKSKLYYNNLIKVFKKYQFQLSNNQQKLEIKQIVHFCRRLYKIGYASKEIFNHFFYFAKNIKISLPLKFIIYIYIKIYILNKELFKIRI